MNKRQKEMLQHQFDSEKAVLKQLEKQYQTALNDINRKIRILQSDEMTQSKIYRLEYQKALKKQVEAILEKLHSDEFTTIQEYLSASYTDSFIGTMYDLAGQGIPLIIPLDQAAAVKAILTDSKISEGLYSALGVDTAALKKSISAEVTRGIASGMAYNDIARNISNVSNAPLSRAKTIARTEGHRIQQTSTRDAQQQAKSKGADVVKQWDSTLDGKTRPSHRRVDGEIRELDEKFSNGLDFPGDPGGKAGEVVNCRCVSLSRARWALDEDELNALKERAEYFGLDKAKTFEDYKKTYLKAAESIKSNISPALLGSAETKNFKELCDYMEKTYGVKVSNKAQALDFETVKDSVSGVEWTMQQFPKTQGYLKKIDSNKKGGVMNCTGNVIACSPTAFDGHYYQGNHKFFISTGVHEATHMTEGYLIETMASGAKEFADMWNSHSVAKGIVKEAVAKLPDDITKGKKYWEIYETISPYASANASECIAEAVSDVYQNGEKASLLSREIFSILKGMTE